MQRRWFGRYLLLGALLGLAGGAELEHRFDVRDRVVARLGPWLTDVGVGVSGAAAKAAAPGTTLEGRVAEVIDGDSLTLRTDDGFHEVRLHQIDAPEYDQPWGSRAEAALRGRVEGQDVRVEVADVDAYGRSVGRLWLRGRDINRELVREGHAWAYRRHLDDRSLLRDERQAREQERGLWSRADAVPPWKWRRARP